MKRTNDLGHDEVFPLVLRLAVPTMLAQLVNVLYSIVDRMYIGAGVGSLALAGVGVCAPIVTLLSSFGSLVGMGGSPLMAMRMGEGNKKEAGRILNNGFLMLLALSIVLTVVFLFSKEYLLMWFGASQATFAYADIYMTIYTAGTFFALMAGGMNSFLIAQGFSGLGMATVVLGAVMNIVLDPVFIFVFGMGVSGAALATILSQAVSAAWVLRFLFSEAGASGLGRLSVEDGPENRRLWPVAVSDYRQRQYSSDCAEHGASALWGAWRRRHPGDLRDDCTELSSAYYNAHGRDYAGKPAGYQLQLRTGGRGPYQKSPALHRGPLPRLLRLYDGDNLYGLSAVCVSVHERRGNRGAFSPLYQDFYGHDHSACGAVSPGG